jgi:hypothetical protein
MTSICLHFIDNKVIYVIEGTNKWGGNVNEKINVTIFLAVYEFIYCCVQWR